MVERFLECIELHCGDCRDVLATLPECSVDSVVTDPPYHIRFMGKQWDGGDIAFRPETWAAVLRVLKPGGHLLAFGGTRTSHRVACAIEDAGFEIRDTIMYLYGSGFPKSHDVSKGVDRAAGAERKYYDDPRWLDKYPNGPKGGEASPMVRQAARSETTLKTSNAVTPEAAQWEGWGTALKPACEPIVLARKPLSEATVVANVLRWGTGAINVDGCRVPTNEVAEIGSPSWGGPMKRLSATPGQEGKLVPRNPPTNNGRWPANVIHDGSAEVVAAFPETGISAGGRIGNAGGGDVQNIPVGQFRAGDPGGSAARFFYSPKADADDRLGSAHPTVKPLDLMQYLVRLVTPRGGVVLDPFAGTGTTGEAAWREGMRAVLIEAEAEYQADIRRRMVLALAGPDERARESIKARNLSVDYGPLFAPREVAE